MAGLALHRRYGGIRRGKARHSEIWQASHGQATAWSGLAGVAKEGL